MAASRLEHLPQTVDAASNLASGFFDMAGLQSFLKDPSAVAQRDFYQQLPSAYDLKGFSSA